jgi:hypothetical protein
LGQAAPIIENFLKHDKSIETSNTSSKKIKKSIGSTGVMDEFSHDNTVVVVFLPTAITNRVSN